MSDDYIDEEREEQSRIEGKELKRKIKDLFKGSNFSEVSVYFSLLHDICLEWSSESIGYLDSFKTWHQSEIHELERLKDKYERLKEINEG